MEVNGFNRIEITGAGALGWLEGLFCGRVPKRAGKVGLGYFLTDRGNVLGEATLANLDETTVWYGSAAAAARHDWDWLAGQLPADGSVAMRALTASHTILVVAGPKARDVLAAAAPRTDWSAAAFPWLSVRRVFIGYAPAVAMSVSFSGELAWEIHVASEQSLAVWQALTAAGEAHGMGRFGLYATESMRIEKGYRHWKADLITEFDPFESALERFVDLGKPTFPGRVALLAKQGERPRRRFVTLRIDSDSAPAHGGASVLAGGRVVGTVTSGAWGHRVGENLAMGFVDPDQAGEGTALEVEVIGRPLPAVVVAPCRYDPENLRMRG
jgi:dimethylglycine dehydrogenase